MRRLAEFADRYHPLALPAAWVLLALGYQGWVYMASSGTPCCWTNDRQLWGTILIYSIVPGYLVAGAAYLWRAREDVYMELSRATGRDLSGWAEQDPPGTLVSVALVVGLLFGLSQFNGVSWEGAMDANPWQDLSLIGGNAIVWMTVSWLAVHWLHVSMGLRSLGLATPVDVYRLNLLKPFARVAVRSVLLVMGAMALMPLQALDAEFRMDNYVFGLAIGLPLAVTLFLLPLTGIRRSILAARQARESELQAAIDAADRSAIPELEALVAHRDRVRAISSWPLDFSLMFRVAFYLIIPPLAWVGAALVETLVQGFIG